MFDQNKNSHSHHLKGKKPGVVTNLIFLTTISLSVTALMVLYIDRVPSNYHEGGIATQNIRADQNYEIIDHEATDKLKQQIAASSPPVYDFDVNLADARAEKIQLGFQGARDVLEPLLKQRTSARDKLEDNIPLTTDEETQLRQGFETTLNTTLDEEIYTLLRKNIFSPELQNTLITLSNHLQKRLIIHDTAELPQIPETGIVLRVLGTEDAVKEELVTNFSHIMSLETAKKFFTPDDASLWLKELNLDFTDRDVMLTAIRIIPSLIKVDLTIDKSETEKRKERAIENVENIVHKLLKGQNIILRGQQYTHRHITILNGINETRLQTNILLKFLGVFCLVFILLFTVYYYAHKHIVHFHLTRKDLNFIGLTLILFLAILRFGSFLGGSLQDNTPFPVDITTFYYIIPVAAGAMIVRYILNAEIALIFSIVLSFFAGMFLEHNYSITTYYFLSSITAAHLIGQVEKRSSVLNRGLLLGCGNALIVLGLSLITNIASATTVDYVALANNTSFAFFGGLITGLTLLAISPVMETIFNYTTNIRLLELADMNHPLLREMIVRAPGTYHHSQLVGVLAEAGTRVIGGNALLARVASYYHDIGKMKKPHYYVENQTNENPHDNLTPSMSALIVESHIKEGMDLAQEHKLPQSIAAFIPEHQGTKLISYFFHKAKMVAGEESGKIDEKDYRYQGPKPQSRESGVVMMADTIEAAVRSLPDKSPQKIRTQVEKLVNNHFVDGQLSNCDLTLRDLYLITEAFIETLIGGIYHQRVEYPEENKKSQTASLTIIPGLQTKADEPLYPESAQPPENVSPLFKEKRQKGS